jgi:hypothetical protein
MPLTPITDPRISWIPMLEDDDGSRPSHKRKPTPWTASRSNDRPDISGLPTKADIKEGLKRLREAEAQYKRILETAKRVAAIFQRYNTRKRHSQIKAANQRLREEMKAYRHNGAGAVPDKPESVPPLLEAS